VKFVEKKLVFPLLAKPCMGRSISTPNLKILRYTKQPKKLRKPKFRFAEHSSPENASPDNFSLEDSLPEDSSLEKKFPGVGRFFAGVFFARNIICRIILR
jgi:hypothetical protein